MLSAWMRRSNLVLLLAALVCSAAAPQATRGPGGEDLNLVAERLRARLRHEPDSPQANLALAAVYLKTGQAELAVAPARRALAVEPANFLARLTLADALLEAHHLAEAQQQFVELSQGEPGRPEVWFGLARASLRLAKEAPDLQGANARLASSALAHLMDCPAPPVQRLALAASVLFDAGQYPKAGELLEQAVRLEPGNGSLWLALGKSCWRNVEFDRAERPLQKALQLQAGDAEAYFMLGDLYARRERPRDALPLLKRSLALDPGADVAHATLARVYAQLDEYPKQIEQLQMIPAARRPAAVWYQLYRAYQRAGRVAEAQQALAFYRQNQKGKKLHADEP